jgi:hypothetical protein
MGAGRVKDERTHHSANFERLRAVPKREDGCAQETIRRA